MVFKPLRTQALEEYNMDLEEGDDEVEKGNFVTNEQLKSEIKFW
ncbi:MAG TPA: hypothetical protein VGM31_13400 [Puia sp.]